VLWPTELIGTRLWLTVPMPPTSVPAAPATQKLANYHNSDGRPGGSSPLDTSLTQESQHVVLRITFSLCIVIIADVLVTHGIIDEARRRLAALQDAYSEFSREHLVTSWLVAIAGGTGAEGPRFRADPPLLAAGHDDLRPADLGPSSLGGPMAGGHSRSVCEASEGAGPQEPPG
jgi:hypothetical protein